MSSNIVDNFEATVKELLELFKAKNADYGSAVDVTYLLFGEVAQLVRLWDKLLRITQLHISGVSYVKSETVDDTLADLANYSLIALAQRKTYEDAPSALLLGDVMTEFAATAFNKKYPGRVEVINNELFNE